MLKHLVWQRAVRLGLVFCWLGLLPGFILAADGGENGEDRNWLEELMHRYFGNEVVIDKELQGSGLESVGPYVVHEGKTIEVIIVRQVKNFESGWDDDRIGAERLLNSFSERFSDYTQEWVIRQYLLFHTGETLVPFDLADSEQLLRDLPYINDVRIHVVPLDGETDKVGIVVETNDRWPVGVNATVITKDRWRAKLFSTNVAGLGLSFSNEILRNKQSQKDWGYRGELLKQNLGGSFWSARTLYEDSYQKNNLLLEVNRPLAHPGIQFVGGANWQYLEEFEDDEYKRGLHQTDLWLGDVIRLYDRKSLHEGARPVLVPAIRVLDRDHYQRPVVYADSNRSYHDFTQYMASVTWQRLKSYKTNFLFGEGEVEDVPTGLSMRLTAVQEEGEFQSRPGVFFDSSTISLRNRGDVTFLGFSVGGFVDEHKLEDGVVDLKGAYFTSLLGQGTIRHRFYGSLNYTQGIGRHTQDRIFLSDRSGIYHLEDGRVSGNKRLVAKMMYRLFTPLSLWGFRMSFFAFSDAGVIADEGAALINKKFYVSSGLGIRLRNPGLVFPTVHLSLSMTSQVESSDLLFGVKMGNVPAPIISFPGTKPGTLAYQ